MTDEERLQAIQELQTFYQGIESVGFADKKATKIINQTLDRLNDEKIKIKKRLEK